MPSTRPLRHLLLLGASVALVVGLTGCGGGDDDGASTAKSSSASAVSIKLVAFKPDKLEITAGTTVTWTNGDPGAHTVTSGEVEQGSAGDVIQHPDGTFDSGQIANGDSFKRVFDKPGTYSYFCANHPATMHGVVVVR